MNTNLQTVSKWLPSASLAWMAAMGFALTPSVSRAEHAPGHTEAAAAHEGHEGHEGHGKSECSCDHECTEKCSKDDTASCGCSTCDCSKGKECEHGKCKHEHKKMKAKAGQKAKSKKAVKKAESVDAAAAPAPAVENAAH